MWNFKMLPIIQQQSLRYLLRNRIIARTAKGMTAQNAFQRQPAPLEGAIFEYGLLGILRAGGGIAAGRRGEWGDAVLIELDEHQQWPCKYLLHDLRLVYLCFC